MRKKSYPMTLLLSALVLAMVSCAGQSGDFAGINELAPEQMEDIDHVVADFMPNYDYISIALVRGGQVILTKTYGRNRLDEIDVYASVSKPVTSIILLQLLEQGGIGSLDDEIARCAPKYRNAQPKPYDDTPITFKHLLTIVTT